MQEFNGGDMSDDDSRPARRNNFRGNSGPRGNFRGNSRPRGNFRSDGPREMHKATCAECGNECEVPFKPTEGKPVYCRDCFRNKRQF